MNEIRSYWRDHEHWVCLRHVPPIRLPATSPRCWMAGCSHRPAMEARPEPTPDEEPLTFIVHPSVARQITRCAHPECSEPARDNSKYCSRLCSNRNARLRHKARQRSAA